MSLINRDQVPVEHTWNLIPLYASPEAWNQEFTALEDRVPTIHHYQGRLAESAATLAEALACYLDLSQVIEKLFTYAHLASDVDTTDNDAMARSQQAMILYTRISALCSYITPELISIPTEKLSSLLADKALAPYRRMVEDIVRYKPHTLSHQEEMLLAQGAEVFGSCQKIFSQLNNADLTFGTVKVDGEEKSLTHGTYQLFLRHKDREVRRTAYQQYYRVFDDHKHTITAALTGSIKKDCYLAQVKKYPSALEASLFADNVQVKVYDNLISTVSNNLGPIHRYYELRRKRSGLSKLAIYDTYLPLVADVKTVHSFEAGSKMLIDSLAPLGKEYTRILAAGLGPDRWVDRYENKGKRSGGYSSGCYESNPYILMNYKDESLNDLYTLTHEAGHSMHSYYSRKNQSYQDHGYAIFVAEVASTFNEQLLTKHLRDQYRNDRMMLAYLINHQLDDIKATLFRQTMFAEFERTTHARNEAQEPLTLDTYRNLYRELLKKYFGPAVEVEDVDTLEFLRIPHMYSAFYVYKYATGISAAVSLARDVLGGAKGAVDRYLAFLKTGCSKFPLDLLKDAGVDMTSPAPIKTAIDEFARLLEELEGLLEA